MKNPPNLTLKPKEVLQKLQMRTLNLKTTRAYQIKLAFQEFYQCSLETAEAFLKKWYFWATHSRLQSIIDVAHTIKRHWKGVLRGFKWGRQCNRKVFPSRITNGVLGGINSLIQAAKARARGYRSIRTLITMTYLIAGKLNFNLPT
ncbi:MAG: transposase [Candidatus Latescibacteria bacterium]|nr:transposase [Candidatus Latescibacterota bacterium]